ncbi:DNA-directed RNA polymerase sigma-70 factor [Sphaerisporangium rufum]|uniref:DNA-directed RNA polymerase sigma-70 factor n=1 Tax=Sphaerisporangium rufum TaxID=1381558 RepID=A0A919R878_9ACTN|nr:RNA polymerase sigma factor [Sphaerisporangium rufum]GII80221.1 DNA-directed RNA polymerase sigma-70 factor [Sphaerisporangium rufum]
MSIPDTGPPGRERRFTDLFTATYPAVLRFAERRVQPSHAEDIVSEVFMVAWRRLDDVPAGPDDARAWLFGIARLTLLASIRGERKRQALAVRISEDPTAGGPDGALEPDLVARRVDLARAWSRLPAVHQEALALTVWDGLDAPRAAQVLGISPVAYRLRLSRARKALRAHARALPEAPAARPATATPRRSST